MDEFARSREDDDLFADEFELISGSDNEDFTKILCQPEVASPEKPQKESEMKNQQFDRRSTEKFKSCRGRAQRTKVAQNESSPSAWKHAVMVGSSPESKETTTESNFTINSPRLKCAAKKGFLETTRMPAVRGDRSLTGGLFKVKLTDAELSAKLERMRILNASKIEKYRLEEADQAAFQSREKESYIGFLEKQKKEHAQILELEKERLKNREHKFRGLQKREWNSRKMNLSMSKQDDNTKITSSTNIMGDHTELKMMNGLEASW